VSIPEQERRGLAGPAIGAEMRRRRLAAVSAVSAVKAVKADRPG
jgi:hypothetical protein